MQLSRRSGQTLLEMVIAIAVITISTLASTTLIIRTISTGRTSQARIEGANLSREGVEVIRGVRDSNWLKADQNVIDYHTPTQPTDTTVQWDDSGLLTDGYVPMSGNYITVFNPTTTTWKLVASNGNNTTIYCVTPTGTTCTTATTGNRYETQLDTGASSCPAGSVCTSTGYTRIVSVALVTTDKVIYAGNGNPCTTPFCFQIPYLTVVSTVHGGGLTKDIVASERLYNWK